MLAKYLSPKKLIVFELIIRSGVIVFLKKNTKLLLLKPKILNVSIILFSTSSVPRVLQKEFGTKKKFLKLFKINAEKIPLSKQEFYQFF